MKKVLAGALAAATAACGKDELPPAPTVPIPLAKKEAAAAPPEAKKEEEAMAFEVRSAAFENATTIPKKYTGDGPDVSPPLEWKNAPAGTKAFALIVDDPDAPVGTWDHWVVVDLPGDAASLAEGAAKSGLPAGAKAGRNSWGRSAWGGPSPPPGKPHRYYFKLYALSAPTGLAAGATKSQVEAAMQGKVLGVAQWMGTYGR